MQTDYKNQLFNSYNTTHVAYLDDDDNDKITWFAEYVLNYVPFLRQYNNDIKILEIGCNKGFLLKSLHDLGYVNIFGIDLSPDDVAIAKNNIPGATINCVDAFDHLRNNANTFDVIILKAVLEHIDKGNIIILLQLIYNGLKPNGTVIIDVPNMDWLFAQHERFMDFTHEVGFTRESLAQLMRNVFNDVSVVKSPWPTPKSIKGILGNLSRPLLFFFIDKMLRIIGEGAADVWWQNRSIIGIGKK